MNLIFIHGRYGKTTLGTLLQLYHGDRAEIVHLDTYVKHAALCLESNNDLPINEIAKHLGEYYRDNEQRVLKELETKIPEIVNTSCDVLIVEGVYEEYMKNILKWLRNNRPSSVKVNWVEVQTHEEVKIDKELMKCNFEIEHTEDRCVTSLKSYLNTLNIKKYFNNLVSQEPRVQTLLSL